MGRGIEGCVLHGLLVTLRARFVKTAKPTTKEETAGLAVRSNTLQQSQCIADSVGSGGSELRWVEQWVYRDDLL